MEVNKLQDVYGIAPQETLASIVADLIEFHATRDLRNFE